MSVWLPIVKAVLDRVLGIVHKHVHDEDTRKRIELELSALVLGNEYKRLEAELEAKKSIIVAEATGHSWLQRNWRPITMLTFVYIIAHNFIFAPLFGLKALPIPPDMWALLKLGIGGYIGGRSLEKVVQMATDAWRQRK